MFARTNTRNAPWFAVAGEHKWQARLSVLKIVTDHCRRSVDLAPQELPKDVRHAAETLLGKKRVKKLLKGT